MKNIRIIYSTLALFIITTVGNAQTVSMKLGAESDTRIPKGSEMFQFTANGNSYFVTKHIDQTVVKYYLETFDLNGGIVAENQLEINNGVFGNTYFIIDVLPVAGTAYAFVEHLDKSAGKNTLSARAINAGKVDDDELDLMSMTYEKALNPGLNHAAVSPNTNMLAVVGELPYVKEQAATIKIALYDNKLQRKSEEEITLPGEDTRNKNIKVAVADDGTVYLIKQTMTKIGEIALAVYQYNKGAGLKEYTFEMTAPDQFYNYTYTVNNSSELIISGTYYKRSTLTVGEKTAVGIFYFTNKGKSEKIFKTFTLDKQVENLTARKILINDNTIFLAAEQHKIEKIAPPPSSTGAAAFDYSYNHTHKSEYVIAMDLDGNKKFELSLAKEFTIKDFDQPYYSAYFIHNGKFNIIYNDRTQKYTTDGSYGYLMPVLVQITNDGLMKSPIIFTDKLRLPNDFNLYPAAFTQNADNTITLLLKNNQHSKYVNLKID